MRFSILWLLTITALVASLTVNAIYMLKQTPKSESRFHPVDGVFNRAEYIDLGPNDILYVRYGGISDSGVEIERKTDNESRWISYSPSLGVPHSEYEHRVFVRMDYPKKGQIEVNSRASGGRFEQIIDLNTGELLKRTSHYADERFLPKTDSDAG